MTTESAAKTWTDLTARQRNQVAVAMTLLGEFEYGYGQLRARLHESADQSIPKRFYENVLMQRVADFYLDGANNLVAVLESVGMVEHAERLRSLLDEKLVPHGKVTLRRPLDDFRNKYLAHPSYTHGLLQKNMRRDYPEMVTPEGKLAYRVLVARLYDETAGLREKLLARFPEVVGHNRDEQGQVTRRSP